MVERIVPSMEDCAPPVTRPITLFTLGGPLKVAASPAFSPKRPKLWNRLPPTCRPSSAPIA
jgi:hypothetical protein